MSFISLSSLRNPLQYLKKGSVLKKGPILPSLNFNWQQISSSHCKTKMKSVIAPNGISSTTLLCSVIANRNFVNGKNLN